LAVVVAVPHAPGKSGEPIVSTVLVTGGFLSSLRGFLQITFDREP
jgi:hypothetical protein